MRFRLGRARRALSGSLFRSLLSMAGPIMAEQAFITLLGLVNAGMAGRAGTEVASGVGLVASVTNLATALFSALALGGTVAVSRARGAGRREDADRAASQCVMLSVGSAAAVSVVLAVFSRPVVDALFSASPATVRGHAASYLTWAAAGYPFLAATLAASGVLRGAGDARTSMVVNVLMNVCNAAAGRVLIFGVSAGGAAVFPALGAAGAGMALSFARAAGVALYAAVFARGAGGFRFRFSAAKDGAAAAAVLAVGIPAAVESFAFMGGKLLTQTYVAGLGAAAAAADYLASAAAGFVQVPLSALSLAVPPLVGAALGRGRPREARAVAALAVFWGSAATFAVDAAAFVFAPALLGLSTDDPAVLDAAVAVFRIFCVASPFLWAASFIVPSALRGAGDGRYTMTVAVASMWVLRVVLGWLLAVPAGLGLTGVWLAMFADWIARAAFFVPRLRGGVWAGRREAV